MSSRPRTSFSFVSLSWLNGMPAGRRQLLLPVQWNPGAGLGRAPRGDDLNLGRSAAQWRHHLHEQRGPAVDPALAEGARGVPAPAVVADPGHWPVIQLGWTVAHLVHRAAGVHVHDGAALAVVQAEDREGDPV